MLTFKERSAHGELTITRMSQTPEEGIGQPVAPVDGKILVGRSETGHHHVVDADCATLTWVDTFTAYLTVTKPTSLDHLRDFDKHEAIALQPGMYRVRRAREFDPFENDIERAIRVSHD